MTAKAQRLLGVLALSSCIGLAGVAAATYVTWPVNTLGNYLHHRQTQQEIVRALERSIAREPELLTREFYQAWLAEEKGDFTQAIQDFESLRARSRPGTDLHLHSSLHLARAHGANHDPEKELATYQALMGRYPAVSLISQATFHLRQGEKEQARLLLDKALAQDAKDGSLGGDRKLAVMLRNGLGAAAGRSSP